MSEHADGTEMIRLTITPEPTDEEVAAVVAVVTALAASSHGAGEQDSEPQVDRWALAGRYEALRGTLWPPGSVKGT